VKTDFGNKNTFFFFYFSDREVRQEAMLNEKEKLRILSSLSM